MCQDIQLLLDLLLAGTSVTRANSSAHCHWMLLPGGWSSCAHRSRRQLQGRRCRVQEAAELLMPVQQSTPMVRCAMVQLAMDRQLRRPRHLQSKMVARRPWRLVQQQQQQHQLAPSGTQLSRTTIGRPMQQHQSQQLRWQHHQTSSRQRMPSLRSTGCWRRMVSPQCTHNLHPG
jgi:hypothetical protein